EAMHAWDAIRQSIANYMLPISSRYYVERKKIIWAFICRAIRTDPSLLVLSLEYQDVPSFLTTTEHDLLTATKLEACLGRMPLSEVRAAIDDVLRPAELPASEDIRFTSVLGIRIYQARSQHPLPFHAWGHVLAFSSCQDCARSICYTVEEIIECQRYALFTGARSFSSCGRALFMAGTTIDRHNIATDVAAICGIVVEHSVKESIAKVSRDDSGQLWEQRKQVPFVSGSLSIVDSQSHDLLNALLRSCLVQKDLTVILRKSNARPPIRSALKIVSHLTRTSQSLAGLQGESWKRMEFSDSILDTLLPRGDCSHHIDTGRIRTECMQFLLLDGLAAKKESWYSIFRLVDLCKEVYKVSTYLELCAVIAAPYIAAGELEVWDDYPYSRNHPGPHFLPNVERSTAAFRALWGSSPRYFSIHDPLAAHNTNTVWVTASILDREWH
ncbi:hypothetical protein R3P38DRAFT_2531497, partial [Favolaschia claudopus]